MQRCEVPFGWVRNVLVQSPRLETSERAHSVGVSAGLARTLRAFHKMGNLRFAPELVIYLPVSYFSSPQGETVMTDVIQEPKEILIGIEEILGHFQSLEDPREPINIRHPLVSVVVIAVMAVLSGASGPTSIALWALKKSDMLLRVLSLPNGIPRKDVFRRVLSALKPAAFQSCFGNWINSLYIRAAEATGQTQPIFAVDGKTLRRSHDHANGIGPLHSVTVWASDFGITLAQVATDLKSNEITAIPKVLTLINLEGAIITIDAMGTQREIAKQIIEGGGGYVLALKGNQETLFQGVVDYIDEQLENDFADVDARRCETEETGHGRIEKRLYVQMPAPATLPGFERWAGLLTIGIAMLTCIRNGKETYECRYFISSLGMGVKLFARAVRSHWGIENGCHWTLDVTYREDESRIRGLYVRENMAWLNRFTLSLLKQHKNKKSVAMNRLNCGWDEQDMLAILTGVTL